MFSYRIFFTSTNDLSTNQTTRLPLYLYLLTIDDFLFGKYSGLRLSHGFRGAPRCAALLWCVMAEGMSLPWERDKLLGEIPRTVTTEIVSLVRGADLGCRSGDDGCLCLDGDDKSCSGLCSLVAVVAKLCHVLLGGTQRGLLQPQNALVDCRYLFFCVHDPAW